MAIQTALPRVGASSVGVRTAFGVLLPPGAKIAAYVGAIQDDSLDAYSVSTLLVGTLQAGLARARAGKGDYVIVLPGHTETVNTADFFTNLVAGTQILGVAPSQSSLMPTLNFTTVTGASFLLDVADVTVSGLKFTVGIDALATFLNVSAAGCRIQDCWFQMGAAAAADPVTAVTVSAGANDLQIVNNRFAGTGTAVSTNCITVSGAVDGLQVINNDFDFQALGATNGAIEFSAAATQFRILRNNIVNRRGTAAVAIRWTDTAGLAGIISENNLAFTADITAATAALSAAGTSNHAVRAFDNQVHDVNQGTSITAQITSAASVT